MMTNSNYLSRAFHDWQETKFEEIAGAAAVTPPGHHLDQKSLLRLAGSGGLDEASAVELEHLDKCPLCLSEWAAWRRAISAADDDFENEFTGNIDNEFFSHQAFGYLEAAASDTSRSQTMVLESNCGTYRLEILPDREDNNQGMIILRQLTDNTAADMTVRDRAGRIIISGPLENGRLARIHKNLAELDLSIWTVG